jgi:hypothetical protein
MFTPIHIPLHFCLIKVLYNNVNFIWKYNVKEWVIRNTQQTKQQHYKPVKNNILSYSEMYKRNKACENFLNI